MPPRPQPQPLRGGRKASTSRDAPNMLQADKDAIAMPPPPVPQAPKGILEPEMTALSNHLKNAMVKTGLIYGFCADTKRLGISKHTPTPPQSLTAALGREVEKYDQLCDSMESHLLRAIAILERDLKREEQRVKEAEEAAKASEMQVEPSTPPAPPASDSSEAISVTPSNSSPTSSIPGRRPSAISISSLQRPSFPLKLDLSAASLRLSPEEASTFGIPDGLHSPVTLAPKSARPQDYPQELLGVDMTSLTSAQPEASTSAHVDTIDLTLPDPTTATSDMNIDPSMGTADKPIELDLDSMDIDMSDLFGDAVEDGTNDAGAGSGVDDLFSPVISTTALAGKADESKEDQNFLNSLAAGGSEDLFSAAEVAQAAAGSSTDQTAPSPGTLLASFTGGSAEGNVILDYNFFGNGEDGGMNLMMDQFLGGINSSSTQGAPPQGPVPKVEP